MLTQNHRKATIVCTVVGILLVCGGIGVTVGSFYLFPKPANQPPHWIEKVQSVWDINKLRQVAVVLDDANVSAWEFIRSFVSEAFRLTGGGFMIGGGALLILARWLSELPGD